MSRQVARAEDTGATWLGGDNPQWALDRILLIEERGWTYHEEELWGETWDDEWRVKGNDPMLCHGACVHLTGSHAPWQEAAPPHSLEDVWENDERLDLVTYEAEATEIPEWRR
jgi:hypothetical protein